MFVKYAMKRTIIKNKEMKVSYDLSFISLLKLMEVVVFCTMVRETLSKKGEADTRSLQLHSF